MDESAKSAERVRNDLQTLRNRSVTVTVNDTCVICNVVLLIRPFFLFPCGHKFHGDCLEKQLLEQLDYDSACKLKAIKLHLASINPLQNNAVESPLQDNLKAEYEQMLGNDCLYCGEVMIASIDEPFIDDWDKVTADWL